MMVGANQEGGMGMRLLSGQHHKRGAVLHISAGDRVGQTVAGCPAQMVMHVSACRHVYCTTRVSVF